MDFASPETITRTRQQRAAHPAYGYKQHPESAYETLIAWLKKPTAGKCCTNGSS